MAVCAGTKRDGEPCTVSVARGERYCYNHNPHYAEERKRSASRAATAKHSSVARELREVRELIWELLGLTINDRLSIVVRKGLPRSSSSFSVTSRRRSSRCGRPRSPCGRTWTLRSSRRRCSGA